MSNIEYKNIKSIGMNVGAFPIGIEGLTEDLIVENGGIINATQIDWNAANLGNNVNRCKWWKIKWQFSRNQYYRCVA